jgi:uncharacterized protein YukE
MRNVDSEEAFEKAYPKSFGGMKDKIEELQNQLATMRANVAEALELWETGAWTQITYDNYWAIYEEEANKIERILKDPEKERKKKESEKK